VEGIGLKANYRWRLRKETPVLRDRLARGLGIDPLVAQVLAHRRVETVAAGREILDPRLASLPDPAGFPDMAAALGLLATTVKERTPLLIHGDYDVDGLCGSALLVRLFRLLGHEASVFLPDRILDGYSFGARSLQAVADRGARVVIAVDNGTTAVEPLEHLHDRGVEVLVVDHHLPGERRPPCAALLNPWTAAGGEAGASGLFPHFCGTGLAWFLAWGLLRHLGGKRALPENQRRFLHDALGLVALATVADVMPLLGPNRILVSHGLKTFLHSSFPGLRALARSAGVRTAPSAQDLGFRLAPRLNAAGRMAQAEEAFRLLVTARPAEADGQAARLESLNEERRRVERHEFQALEAEARACAARGDGVLFLGRPGGHFGVLGIVASRLREATGLPALLWTECAPGIARGSGRGPDGCDLVELLGRARAHLLSFGGHAKAAGFSFDPRQAGPLGDRLREAAEEMRTPRTPSGLEIDLEVDLRELTRTRIESLDRLAPFGEKHPQPVFLSTGLRLAAPPRRIGDGSHAALLLEQGGGSMRALAWKMGDRLADLQAGDRVDVVFHPGINAFRGQRTVELTLQDLRSSLS